MSFTAMTENALDFKPDFEISQVRVLFISYDAIRIQWQTKLKVERESKEGDSTDRFIIGISLTDCQDLFKQDQVEALKQVLLPLFI